MGEIELSRNSEALMNAAGYGAPWRDAGPTPEADLRLERSAEDQWRVEMISSRAHDWAARELSCPLRQCFAGQMRLDMMSADRLLKQASAKGFRTEFIGGSGKDIV